MKLKTKYLGMSKLFEYPIKSYLTNLTWCEMPWNILQHIGLLHIRGTKTLSPSFCCFCSTIHTSLLAWPFFFCRWYSFWKMSFKKSQHIFVCGMMALKFPDTSASMFSECACTSSTLNFKWSILVCPEFARHITIQFRTVIFSNLLNSFIYHLLIFFLSKR